MNRFRSPDQPKENFDIGLQHERTALAWERTAIAGMVAGTVLARYGAQDGYLAIAVVGMVQVFFGAIMLVWTGVHYNQLHGPLRAKDPVVFPEIAILVGRTTIAFTSVGVLLATATILRR